LSDEVRFACVYRTHANPLIKRGKCDEVRFAYVESTGVYYGAIHAGKEVLIHKPGDLPNV